MPIDNFIPVCEPTLSLTETQYVNEAVTSGWISSAGKFIEKFETEFSKKVGARHGISVCNGTAALHLALDVLGVGPGDEVILPSFTMVASANAIVLCGARPVFVDSDAESYTIDPELLEKAITPRTKAIMTVSIYGHPSDFDRIHEICKKHNLKWLEDGAESHGALYKGQPVSKFADVTAYSFFANKIISTGEGGMLCTNSQELADRARVQKNLGFKINGPRNYIHETVAYNYRMTNIQAALGCAQTERFEELVGMRQRNAELYTQRLREHGEFIAVPKEKPWAKSCHWMYGIRLKGNLIPKRDRVMGELKNQKVDTRPFFFPMHMQPIYKTAQNLPVAEMLSASGFYLPSSSHLTEHQIDQICQVLITIVNQEADKS